LDIYGNGWGNDEQKMLTSAKILYKLDFTGLFLSSNRWLDDDKE
jgi:hypothetical protein